VGTRSRPNQPVGAGRDVVGKARQDIAERYDGALVRAGELVAAQRVSCGLGDHDVRLVGGQGDPVGEGEAVGELVHAPAWGSPEQTTGRAVLEQVTAPVLEPELGGGVGEVDGPVGGNRGVVAERHGAPVDRRDQLGDRAVFEVEVQDAAVDVADDDTAVWMQLEAERTTGGVTHHRVLSGAGIDRHDARPSSSPVSTWPSGRTRTSSVP